MLKKIILLVVLGSFAILWGILCVAKVIHIINWTGFWDSYMSLPMYIFHAVVYAILVGLNVFFFIKTIRKTKRVGQ